MSKNVFIFDIIMVYKNLSKNKIKELRSLHSKKGRVKSGMFMVEGYKSITDMIDSFELMDLICEEEWIDKNPIFKDYADKVLIDKEGTGISQISALSTPPEVIAIFKIPATSTHIPELKPDEIYILLDEIQDPGNMGTIIRTCDWFGVYDIFASYGTVDIYNPKTLQSSMGSLSRVKVHYVDLKGLIENNPSMKVYGTLLDGVPLQECKIDGGGLIIMGNEGNGISGSLKKLITDSIFIPPVNPESHPDSLNVGIATAIILSHFLLK